MSYQLTDIFFQVDGSGTIATEDRLQEQPNKKTNETTSNSVIQDEAAVPINENLFQDDDLEDLEDELNDLDVDQ